MTVYGMFYITQEPGKMPKISIIENIGTLRGRTYTHHTAQRGLVFPNWKPAEKPAKPLVLPAIVVKDCRCLSEGPQKK
jgi:hypothetical protein